MRELKTAVIIGAGTGGLATAIFLARKGFTVNIYEQSETIGTRGPLQPGYPRRAPV